MRLLATALLLLASPISCQATEVVSGELGGAKFTIAVPEKWNGVLVLLAHGMRSEKTAELSADLGEHKPMTDAGWMVAATSYRRNGWIIDDAIKDIANLRAYIVSKYGKPSMVLVQGMSMGGLIATMLAERGHKNYDGFVAIGPALGLAKYTWGPPLVNCSPKKPIIFLVNRSEIADPTIYTRRSQRSPVPPALWSVAREGHCNVNANERYTALKALLEWIRTGKIDKSRDATQ